MNQSTFLWEELPVSPSPSPDSEKDWAIRVVTSCLPTVRLLNDIGPAGWLGRMSPVSCRLTTEGILEPSWGCWQNSGMGSPTEFLTLNSPEHNASPEQSPNEEGVCSLSDILEIGDLPQRHFLSARACKGLLLRIEKRGKETPPALKAALNFAARSTLEITKTPAQTD